MNASKPDQQGILPRDLFAGKTVFVTGGGSGINLGIARPFGGLGGKIGICGRSQERLDAAAAGLRELGAKVTATSADVRMPDQLQSAMTASRDTLGDIDVLVCGAAGNFLVKGENLSFNGFKTIVDIDLVGAFNASRIAFDQLKRTRGSILFVTAPMAMMPHAYQADVGPAKAGVEMLMKNLALEWGPYGIRSNSIIPGFVSVIPRACGGFLPRRIAEISWPTSRCAAWASRRRSVKRRRFWLHRSHRTSRARRFGSMADRRYPVPASLTSIAPHSWRTLRAHRLAFDTRQKSIRHHHHHRERPQCAQACMLNRRVTSPPSSWRNRARRLPTPNSKYAPTSSRTSCEAAA